MEQTVDLKISITALFFLWSPTEVLKVHQETCIEFNGNDFLISNLCLSATDTFWEQFTTIQGIMLDIFHSLMF